jgi:hypothetical protein
MQAKGLLKTLVILAIVNTATAFGKCSTDCLVLVAKHCGVWAVLKWYSMLYQCSWSSPTSQLDVHSIYCIAARKTVKAAFFRAISTKCIRLGLQSAYVLVLIRNDPKCLTPTGARLLTKQARSTSFIQRRAAISKLKNVMSPTQDPRSSDPSSGPSGQPESQAPPGTTKDMEQAPDHGEKSYKGTGKKCFYP